mgnify:CR=1 FL=1
MIQEGIRFGLVGHGLWGAHHAKAIAQTQGALLTAIADRAEVNLAAAHAAHPKAALHSDWRELVARPDIDVVDVAVPSFLHFEVARAAMEAGKHVFLEKPMVLSIADANELIRMARSKGLMLAVDHEMRLSELWGKVKKLIEEGVVGIPQYVLVELSRFPYRQGADGWRYDIRRVGNWILEEPIHFIDLAKWYMSGHGDPTTVFARANSRQAEHPELQDNFTTVINFTHGGYAVVTQTLAAFEHHVTCKVSGSEGAVWAWWSGADARSDQPTFGLRYARGGEVEEVSFQKATGEVVELQQQVASLVAVMRQGGNPPATGEDGRWAVALCLAAQQAVDAGAAVMIAPFGP